MAPDFNLIARILMQGVLADHPDWNPHVFPYGPVQAEEEAVMFRIPAPKEPAHHLEIAHRGNAIEIAYDCGCPGLRAEALFVFRDGEIAGGVQDVCAFLNDVCTGKIVIVRQSLGKIVRALRRDGVSELAWFRTADEVAATQAGRYSGVHTWT